MEGGGEKGEAKRVEESKSRERQEKGRVEWKQRSGQEEVMKYCTCNI